MHIHEKCQEAQNSQMDAQKYITLQTLCLFKHIQVQKVVTVDPTHLS